MPGDNEASVRGGYRRFGEPGDARAWVRVANTLLERIERRQYQGRLPGRAALAAEFGVAARTIQRAVTELAELDVVYRVPGLGYHVRGGQDAADGKTMAVNAAGGGEDQSSGDPRAWIQVSTALLDRITRGDLKPWQMIPPRKTLCAEFGCSRSPVTHALTHLERRGILRRIPGTGYQVRPLADDLAQADHAAADVRLASPAARAGQDRALRMTSPQTLESGRLSGSSREPRRDLLSPDAPEHAYMEMPTQSGPERTKHVNGNRTVAASAARGPRLGPAGNGPAADPGRRSGRRHGGAGS
jgi:DNA-binding GntR family transcriptional regulator